MSEKKVDADPMLGGVFEALGSADLPEACRAMLLALAPGCFETPVEERQEPQAVAASMIGNVITSQFGTLEKAVQDEDAHLQQAEAALASSQVMMLQAEAELAEKRGKAESAKLALEGVSQELMVAKESLAAARREMQAGEDKVAEARNEKKAVVDALQDHFAPLRDGAWETGQGKTHIAVVLDLAKRLQLELSLVTAMPSSCTKRPSERGPFDQMVVSKLEELLREKARAFQGRLDAAAPEAFERLALVEAAQRGADAAAERQQQAADVLSSALGRQKQQEADLEDARSAVRTSECRRRSAAERREQRDKARKAFHSRSVVCFESLRDRSAVVSPAQRPLATEVKEEVVAELTPMQELTAEPEVEGQVTEEQTEFLPAGGETVVQTSKLGDEGLACPVMPQIAVGGQ